MAGTTTGVGRKRQSVHIQRLRGGGHENLGIGAKHSIGFRCDNRMDGVRTACLRIRSRGGKLKGGGGGRANCMKQ